MSAFTSDYFSNCALSGLKFEFLNKSTIYKLSVKEIQSPFALDKLLNPVPNGLYDLALGPIDKNDVCVTCYLDFFKCPGHYGHINLTLPVYNPIFFKDLVKLLRASCLSCHTLLATPLHKSYFIARMRLLDYNLLNKIDLVDLLYSKICFSQGDNALQLVDTCSFGDEFRRLTDHILAEETAHTLDKEPNRNVYEAKIRIVKEFMESCLMRVGPMCPYCKVHLTQLRAEMNSKIFVKRGAGMLPSGKKGASKQQSDEKRAALKKQREKQIMLDSGDGSMEIEVPDDMEKALDGEVVELDDDDDDHDDMDNRPQQDDAQASSSSSSKSDQIYLTPVEVQKHLRLLCENDRETLIYLLGKSVDEQQQSVGGGGEQDISEMFFFECVAVPPSRFRPISTLRDQKFENARTTQLSKLIQTNTELKECLVEILKEDGGTRAGDVVTEDAELLNGDIQCQEEAALERISKKLAQKKTDSKKIERVQNAWLQVQQAANLLYDADLDKLNREHATNGLKQVLEKKEGLFRKHMMGKRVNFAGRSVISPDVYIGTDEIGIPEVFAKKLTYPQPVNAFNYWEMRQAVLNGPDVHPGATMVEYGNGHLVRLRAGDPQGREAIAKQLLTPESSVNPNLDIKIVHRHLKNGDVLLFNRQPTLHRPSIMAHKARVLPHEKTLRMHYSNCKSYNADFDGDEMNAHLPQNELARSEALNLVLSSNHYLVPKDGTPLGGLIHDHVVGGSALTFRDRFFNRADYQQLVYQSLHNSLVPNVRLLPPAIIKPKALWTGKQVVTTLMINLLPFDQKGGLNLEGKAKIPSKSWFAHEKSANPLHSSSSDEYMNDSYVLIRNGHLLNGVLDKAHYGSSSYSLVHCCYELYGPASAGELLTCFGRLFTAFIQTRGFTLGVEDILLRPHVQKPMQKIRKRVTKCGFECLAKVCTATSETSTDDLIEQYRRMHLSPDESLMQEVDLAYKGGVDKFQNQLTQICFPDGLVKRFPDNNLQLMIQSGAKGSSVNSMQMSCLLGQQELEGRRPRLMVGGNTLPSFLPYDPSPVSGGFICNSFMSGLTPQEYFFHCMAGREGLVDTAVKTSRSGYLQRCLIKHLEGLVVNYDLTVRDSDNSLIQFQYGEDSLAIEKTPFLSEKHLSFMANNSHILMSNADEIRQVREKCTSKRVRKETEKIRAWKKELAQREHVWQSRRALMSDDDCTLFRCSPFLDFSWQLLGSDKRMFTIDFADRVKLAGEEWRQLDDDRKHEFVAKCPVKCRLPVTANYASNAYLGAISENLEKAMETYLKKRNPIQSSSHLSDDEFKELFYLKCMQSCITPGDSVGILAAQSIGEPSTQMTLNTFHFAGRGDMNVTLGIPRLREILMVASNQIKTPSMQVPVRDSQLAAAERIKLRLTPTHFWHCLSQIDIEQTLQTDTEGFRRRVWLTNVRVSLVSQHELTYVLGSPLSLADLIAYVETNFVKKLCIAINKKYNQIAAAGLLHASKVTDKSMKNFKNINQNEDGGGLVDADDSNDNDNDEDIMGETDTGESMGAKMKLKKNDELEYEEEEDEETDKSEDEDGGDKNVDENANQTNGSEGLSDGGYLEDNNESGVEILDDLTTTTTTTTTGSQAKRSRKMNKHRVKAVLKISDIIESYSYDSENHRWFSVSFKLDVDKPRLDMYTLVQKEAQHSSISKVSGVKRCFLNQSNAPGDNGCFKLTTEGINTEEIIKNCAIFDTSKLYLNDIHLMAAKFGIEAASKVLINEIKQVFGVYGINVDYRHLSLIADYMTYEGVYKPFNRIGIKSNASPLQKMSFETCMQFFKDAYLYNQKESIKSPSACLVTGRLVRVGSNLCDILTKLIT